MNKLFFIFCLLFCVFLKAQNNVMLTSSNGKVFRVILKGKPVNATLEAHVLLEKISSDTLPVELEFENRKKIPLNIYLLEQGQHCINREFSYNVEFNDVTARLVFLSVYDILPLPDPLVPAKPKIDTSINLRNNSFAHFCELKDGKPFYFNNLPKGSNCSVAMTEDYMNYTALLISKAEVPDQKFAIVENVCRNNCISVSQLSQLLNYIDYEIDKLKMVRLAYVHLSDPNNSAALNKNFRFEASQNELHSFLKDPGHSGVGRATNCTKAASEMVVNAYIDKLAVFNNDSERLEVLKKGYADLCYSTEQAARILNKFIHDREKLEAAKLLYFNCVDKSAYIQVTEVFSYNQTSNELKDFIDKQTH